MLNVAKMDGSLPSPSTADDITIGALLDGCDRHAASPLVFSCEGRAIRPGYHVTEVKAGDFAALDCGGNPEAWSEIFIQLWDVIDGDRIHMTAENSPRSSARCPRMSAFRPMRASPSRSATA